MNAAPRDEVERVWREQGGKLWRSLLAFSGDPEIATDSAAEAFAQALGRGDGVRDQAAWIWRAAFRIAAGDLQDRRRRSGLPPYTDASVELPEPVVDLVKALRSLTERQRASVVLHMYADMPTREVARTLGCSQATVRVHLSQARRRLRVLLEADDG